MSSTLRVLGAAALTVAVSLRPGAGRLTSSAQDSAGQAVATSIHPTSLSI
jgi:hypothetical protein